MAHLPPEFTSEIIGHLINNAAKPPRATERTDLLHCALVCHLCADLTLPFLWPRAPHRDVWEKVSDDATKYYMKKVRSLRAGY